MKKYYVITMTDGSEWGIPAEIIAKNRAEYYAKVDPDTIYQEEFDAMMQWFDTKDFEFEDWAQNNMNWSDVQAHAVMLNSATRSVIDWEKCWMNGEHEYRTVSES